jgi:cell wall-associated NlpC family hydrolase
MGIPFVEHGRDYHGCDCYGLVRLVLLEQFGTPLPELLVGYADTRARQEIARMIDVTRPLLPFAVVVFPRPGDVVLIRNGGALCHFGVMVTARLLLHSEDPAGPRFDLISSPLLKPRIEGIYRHAA